MAASRLDLTEYVPGSVSGPAARGHLHLVSQTRDALEDVFVGMGFEVAEGPEIETRLVQLRRPQHPPGPPGPGHVGHLLPRPGRARDDAAAHPHLPGADPPHGARRARRNAADPLGHARAAATGGTPPTPGTWPSSTRSRGWSSTGGSPSPTWPGTIETFTTAYFGPDIHSRLRPAYFPFTEPSAEFEVTCAICRGEGCRTCSQTGWIELGGCGMVDPAVFAAVGIDADVWTGFAFGFGIDRCAQMRHQIADMRALIENDIRFLRQF